MELGLREGSGKSWGKNRLSWRIPHSSCFENISKFVLHFKGTKTWNCTQWWIMNVVNIQRKYFSNFISKYWWLYRIPIKVNGMIQIYIFYSSFPSLTNFFNSPTMTSDKRTYTVRISFNEFVSRRNIHLKYTERNKN